MKKETKGLRIAEVIIEILKINLAIKPLQFFCRPKYYNDKLEQMRNLPKHTIGSDIAEMLDKKNLKIIPKYEDHDLKHLILGYGMSPIDELRMQAYLFGNGNYSLTCILFLSSALLLPHSWKKLYTDFKIGKQSQNILHLKLKDCLEENTESIKLKYAPNRSSINVKNKFSLVK